MLRISFLYGWMDTEVPTSFPVFLCKVSLYLQINWKIIIWHHNTNEQVTNITFEMTFFASLINLFF